MTDPRPALTPATPSDLEAALTHALRFDGRKSFKLSGESMAQITAAHLVRYLDQSGFVVMKRPAADVPTTCAYGESAARVMARANKLGE